MMGQFAREKNGIPSFNNSQLLPSQKIYHTELQQCSFSN